MLIQAGQIISSSVKLYRDNFKLFITYAALLFIPTAVMQLVSILTGADQKIMTSSVILMVLLAIAVWLISLWLSLAFINVIAKRYNGNTPKSIEQEIIQAKVFFVSALLASILAGLAILGGFILLIIPGIIFSVWFAFAIYTVLFENKKGADALKASKALVSGRWWSVLWRLLAPGVVFTILTIIIQAIASVSLSLNELFGTVGIILSTLIIGGATFLVVPLSTIAPTILYLELKKTPVKAVTTPQEASKE